MHVLEGFLFCNLLVLYSFIWGGYSAISVGSVSLTVSEVEELGYYDFMAYLEVPFFNIGGAPSMDVLADRCEIDEDSHVLDVGCGTGGNAAYLAENYGCRVTGVDISGLMIEQANRRASELGIEDRLSFQVGDAYGLEFPEESFDTVITIFVSQFLDLERAFPEFMLVLKKEGFLGINEMYREGNVPAEDVERVEYAEHVFRELTGLPFRLRSSEEWRRGFENAGFEGVSVEAFSDFLDMKRGLGMIKEFGGLVKLVSILWRVVVLGLRSEKIRERYSIMNRGKRVMLRDKETRKYFGYVLGVGNKTLE
jgi:ubiquinone/menaquinone biosynthesis C-methylase UbiE